MIPSNGKDNGGGGCIGGGEGGEGCIGGGGCISMSMLISGADGGGEGSTSSYFLFLARFGVLTAVVTASFSRFSRRLMAAAALSRARSCALVSRASSAFLSCFSSESISSGRRCFSTSAAHSSDSIWNWNSSNFFSRSSSVKYVFMVLLFVLRAAASSRERLLSVLSMTL